MSGPLGGFFLTHTVYINDHRLLVVNLPEKMSQIQYSLKLQSDMMERRRKIKKSSETAKKREYAIVETAHEV